MPPKLLLDKSRTLMELALQINGAISPLNLLWETEKKNLEFGGVGSGPCSKLESGMKISDISVDMSPIYPILVMFDTISAMTDISPIYRFWTDIS